MNVVYDYYIFYSDLQIDERSNIPETNITLRWLVQDCEYHLYFRTIIYFCFYLWVKFVNPLLSRTPKIVADYLILKSINNNLNSSELESIFRQSLPSVKDYEMFYNGRQMTNNIDSSLLCKCLSLPDHRCHIVSLHRIESKYKRNLIKLFYR